MNYQHLIDTTQDSEFCSISNLRWAPWTGKRFQTKGGAKLLLVGESHYAKDAEKETAESVQVKQEADRFYTRQIIWECPVSDAWKNRTLGNIPRLLIGASQYNRVDFWQDAAFYNFVQRMVKYTGSNPERPTNNDFSTGWEVFCKVLEITKPGFCIFLGSQARHTLSASLKRIGVNFTDAKRSKKVGRCWAYRAGIHITGKETPIVFIQHPGKYFSSTAWHQYLLDQLPREISELKQNYTAQP